MAETTAKPTTTDAGIPVASDEHSLTVGPDGPVLLQDHYLIEQMANFNRERIPERQPHAKGGGAFGRFETTSDVSAYTKAALFQPGADTDLLIRFSTVAGERGSPDTWRDPRGFSIKFCTSGPGLRCAGPDELPDELPVESPDASGATARPEHRARSGGQHGGRISGRHSRRVAEAAGESGWHHDVTRGQIVDRGMPQGEQHRIDPGAHDVQHVLDTRLAVGRQAPQIGTPEHDGPGAQGHGLDHVTAAADAAVQHDLDAVADGFADGR